MKKIIDLLAGAGSHKDEKLLDYVRRNYLINNKVTNICFVTGVEDKSGIHTQITADELKELVFKKNDKNTMQICTNWVHFSDITCFLFDICDKNVTKSANNQSLKKTSNALCAI